MSFTKITEDSWVEFGKLPKHLEFNLFHRELVWCMRPSKPLKAKIYGRECEMKRLQKVYGRDYTFSGKTQKCEPIPVIFYDLIDYFNKKYKRNFNMILVNWYRDGNDYISFHSDNEKQIKEDSEIVTISIGGNRDFIIKNKKSNNKLNYEMYHNSFITMGGKCQKETLHGVPKRKKVKYSRVSITLREFI